MSASGKIFIREIIDSKRWEEIREDFYSYINRWSDEWNILQVYEYDNFLNTKKKVLIVYKGDSPSGYGDGAYLVFPEFYSIESEIEDLKEILEACEMDKSEIEKEIRKKYGWYFEFKEKFLPLLGKPFEYEIWT